MSYSSTQNSTTTSNCPTQGTLHFTRSSHHINIYISIGGLIITMAGDGFVDVQNVFINSAPCTDINVTTTFDHTVYVGTYMLTCILPPGNALPPERTSCWCNVIHYLHIIGSGADQPIVISANQQFSSTKRLLSYGEPTVTSLIGCTQLTGGHIGTCDRLGAQPITIR